MTCGPGWPHWRNGSMLRALRIWAVALQLLVRLWWNSQRWSYWGAAGFSAERLARRQRRLSRWLTAEFLALGSAFIKLGQMLSARPDVFPAEVVEELTRLQDQVPPISFEVIQGLLEAELGGRCAEIIDLEAERSARQGDDPLYRLRQQHVRQRAELDEEHKRRREALALEQQQAFENQHKRLQEDLERRAREEDEIRQRRAENARPGADAGIIDRLTYNFNQTVEKFKDLLDPQRVIERQRREQEEEKRRQQLREERARREREAMRVRQKEQEREMLEATRQRENSEKANLLQAQDKEYYTEREKIEREQSRTRAHAQEQTRDNKDRTDGRDDRDDDDRR